MTWSHEASLKGAAASAAARRARASAKGRQYVKGRVVVRKIGTAEQRSKIAYFTKRARRADRYYHKAAAIRGPHAVGVFGAHGANDWSIVSRLRGEAGLPYTPWVKARIFKQKRIGGGQMGGFYQKYGSLKLSR